MKYPTIAIWLSLIISSNLYANPCAKNGMDVLKANDGSGYIFYIYRKNTDLVFVIPGKEISFPSGFSGPKRFFIDGLLYEIVVVDESDFLKSKQYLSDDEVLNAHMAYEEKYILDSHLSPLTKMVESGINVKSATATQPEFSFNLWQSKDPKNENGPSQYYVSTVTSGEVVYLSVISKSSNEASQVMGALHGYTDSFQHILNKQQCPKK